MKRGFTLIEVLVVVAIAAVVLGFIGAAITGKPLFPDNGKFNPYLMPRQAQAQALQDANEIKEREIKAMEENNRLMRELLEKNK